MGSSECEHVASCGGSSICAVGCFGYRTCSYIKQTLMIMFETKINDFTNLHLWSC